MKYILRFLQSSRSCLNYSSTLDRSTLYIVPHSLLCHLTLSTIASFEGTFSPRKSTTSIASQAAANVAANASHPKYTYPSHYTLLSFVRNAFSTCVCTPREILRNLKTKPKYNNLVVNKRSPVSKSHACYSSKSRHLLRAQPVPPRSTLWEKNTRGLKAPYKQLHVRS
jgi:hypothetical protein